MDDQTDHHRHLGQQNQPTQPIAQPRRIDSTGQPGEVPATKEKDGDLEAVAEYYGYNRRAAKAALDILSSEHINIIKKKIQKGET